jgi:hypothetical protein
VLREGEEMTQTLYAHMNKIKIKKNNNTLLKITNFNRKNIGNFMEFTLIGKG